MNPAIDLTTTTRKYISVEEFAQAVSVKARTVYYWIDKGALPAIRMGKVIRIKVEEARKFSSTPARQFA